MLLSMLLAFSILGPCFSLLLYVEIHEIRHFLVVLGSIATFKACRSFHELFFNDRVLWTHVFRKFIAHHCLAPHSFDLPIIYSAFALRQAATRFYRIADEIAGPDRPMTFDTYEYQLELFASGIIRHDNNRFYHLGDALLPGGRWLLSVVGEMTPEGISTHLCCSDLFSAVDGKLEPITYITFNGVLLQTTSTGVVKIQLCEGGDSVAIACLFAFGFRSGGNDMLAEVLLLTWDPDGCPNLSKAAALNISDLSFLSADGSKLCVMSLAGDFISFETLSDLAVWNWRSDKIVVIDSDPKQNQWGSGQGYALQVVGNCPLIYIIPTNERELLLSELPPLAPRGTSEAQEKKSFASTQTIPMHPEISSSTEVFSIIMLEAWKPPSMQTTAIIFCRDHQHLMRLELDNPGRFTQKSVPSFQGAIDDSLRTKHNVEYLSLGDHHRFGRCFYTFETQSGAQPGHNEASSQTTVRLASYSLNGGQVQNCSTRILPFPAVGLRAMTTKELCMYSGTALLYIDDSSSPRLNPSVRVMYF
ncbi:hypothetical protein DL93DRAFT_2070685, partial [Clavulina sp. PMI_390]